jgi:hypothetical protein
LERRRLPAPSRIKEEKAGDHKEEAVGEDMWEEWSS